MRTFIASTLVILGVVTALPVGSANAAAMPRYSSVVDQTAAKFVVSYRNMDKTEYITCTLPAPITCGSPTAQQENLTGGMTGAYRNEGGTLLVTAKDGALTAYENNKGAWEKLATWEQTGTVTRVLVAADGKHFAVFTTDGAVTSYEISKDVPVASTRIDKTGSSLTLSSTGKYLAWYEPASLGSGKGQRCYAFVDLVSGAITKSCEAVGLWDLVTEDNRTFAFSPDDKNVVFRSDRDGYQTPYRINLEKGLPKTFKPERLIPKAYQVADMVFVDNDRLAVVANRTAPTTWSLWALNIKTGSIASIAERASYGVSLKKFGTYVSFAQTGAGGVSAALWNTKSNSVTDISTLASGITVASGGTVPAPKTKVMNPQGGGYAVWEPSKVTKTTPIVIWMHGGPYRQISTAGYHPFASYGAFDWMLEEVRQSGAIIAKVDYPGSYGYGRAYADGLAGNVGKTDVAAVANVMKAMSTKYGTTAPIYLIGNSYGGYLADKVLVEKPSSIKGIFSISGVSGWEELVAGNPETIFSAQFKNAPFGEVHPLFQQAEVLLKLNKIGSQKIILAHGDSDTSVSVSQTKTLDQALQIEKKNVTTVIYPGENHVFNKSKDIQDLCKRAIGLVGGNSSGRCQL